MLIELLVVVAIIVVVIHLVYGTRTATGPSGEPRTRPGAAIERARAVECQQNLRGLRQAISVYRIGSEQPPASLAELRAGATTCPESGNPYLYDPATGTVRCTTPGHEGF